MNPIETIQQNQAKQADQKRTDDYVNAIISAIGAKVNPKDVRILGSSIDKLTASLDKLDSLNLDLRADQELKTALSNLSQAVSAIEVKPVVKVPDPKVVVKDNPVDLTPIINGLQSLEKTIKGIKTPPTDTSSLESAIQTTTEAINNLSFPAANFILPFKGNDGEATQVQLDSSGNIPVSGTVSIDKTGLATDTNQTSGSQKTQVVDASGNTITSAITTPGASDRGMVVRNIPSGTQTVSGTVTANLAGTGSLVDNAAFTDGTTRVVMGGYILNETAGTALTENDAAAARIDSKRAVVNVLEDATTRGQRASISAGGALKVDNSAVTQPVSAASLPLPTGAATSANQSTANTSLSNIDTSTASKYITGIGHGVKTVTTAGTDVALAASTACKRVTIQAQTDNTGWIAVGASGVDATESTGTGVLLAAGDVFELDIDNLSDVFIDSTVNGEGVRYTYFT